MRIALRRVGDAFWGFASAHISPEASPPDSPFRGCPPARGGVLEPRRDNGQRLSTEPTGHHGPPCTAHAARFGNARGGGHGIDALGDPSSPKCPPVPTPPQRNGSSPANPLHAMEGRIPRHAAVYMGPVGGGGVITGWLARASTKNGRKRPYLSPGASTFAEPRTIGNSRFFSVSGRVRPFFSALRPAQPIRPAWAQKSVENARTRGRAPCLLPWHPPNPSGTPSPSRTKHTSKAQEGGGKGRYWAGAGTPGGLPKAHEGPARDAPEA